MKSEVIRNSIWVEKYRPKKIEDCILPETTKDTFRNIVASGVMQNLLLKGTSGVGKTTIALALAEEMGYDALVINASLDAGIDVIRSEVTRHASSLSLSGNPKMVIFDEADYLSASSVQPALRGFIEQFHNNCRFIFTCNFENRIIDPIHSRCSVIDFKISGEDKPTIASLMFKRACSILKKEGIEFDKKVVAQLITKHFPDFRRVLNELQRYSVSGKIDSGILLNLSESSFKELLDQLKAKNFNEVRKWVGVNSDMSAAELFRSLYDHSNDYVLPASLPQLIIILADYGYKDAFVTDKEINIMAAMVEIMASIKWK